MPRRPQAPVSTDPTRTLRAVRPPDHQEAAVETSSDLTPSALTSGGAMRRASISSVLAAVALSAVAVVATSVRQPIPSSPPVGAVGVVPSRGQTEPPESFIDIQPSPAPTEIGEASDDPSALPSPSARATPRRTSPPSGCNPYVTPCDPTIMPVYPYVSVLITTNGSTDADVGFGRVTVVAAGDTYRCTTRSRPASCYYEVPPGTEVTATAAHRADSVCTYFYVIWEDYSTERHDDCSPITFTQKKQKALLVANFDRVPTAPPATPADPPATPEPTPTLETPADPPTPNYSPGSGVANSGVFVEEGYVQSHDRCATAQVRRTLVSDARGRTLIPQEALGASLNSLHASNSGTCAV